MGFANSVIGGGGTLVRNLMKSANYVAGVAGWKIAKDGTAELNNTTIRGTLAVVNANGSEVDVLGSLVGETPNASVILHPPPNAGYYPGSNIVPGYVAADSSVAVTQGPSLKIAGPVSDGIADHGNYAPSILMKGPAYPITGPNDAVRIEMDANRIDIRETNAWGFAGVFVDSLKVARSESGLVLFPAFTSTTQATTQSTGYGTVPLALPWDFPPHIVLTFDDGSSDVIGWIPRTFQRTTTGFDIIVSRATAGAFGGTRRILWTALAVDRSL